MYKSEEVLECASHACALGARSRASGEGGRSTASPAKGGSVAPALQMRTVDTQVQTALCLLTQAKTAVKGDSTPRALLSLALTRQVRLFLSPPIREEYQAAWVRPKFGLDPREVATLLERIRHVGVMVYPSHPVTQVPHEPDNRFLECAQAAKVDYVVTGNKRHFPFPEFVGSKIVTPREFARVVAEELYGQA